MKKNQNKILQKEYVSFSESDAIKGILILLIILGHNHYLAPKREPLFNFLYLFHVICFFILPFFYNKLKELSFNNIRDIIVRCYIPYFFFFILCTFIYVLTSYDNEIFDFGKVCSSLYAFFNGSEVLLKENAGFNFVWFLPAFCSFSILKICFDHSNKTVKLIIVLVSCVLVFYKEFTKDYLFPYIPFAIVQGFYFFAFGFVTWFLVNKIPYIKYVGAVVFIVFSFIFSFEGETEHIKVLFFIFPTIAFMLLLSLKKLIVYIPFLQQLGRLIFPVYLVHVIIYNVLEKILSYSILNAVITYVLTILLSVVAALFMTKISFIQKLVLPKGYSDFKSLFVKKTI
jgi:fucose 4-O-acetylase-like acetyltransferase